MTALQVRIGYCVSHKQLQGTHLKRWTLRSVIWTDVTCRAIPWSRLILETNRAYLPQFWPTR